jgi:WD40 repeat protein
VLKGHTHNVTSVAFSSDGNQICSGSGDHSVQVWNAKTHDQQTNLQEYNNQIDLVASLRNNNQIESDPGDHFIHVSANSHVDTSWVIDEDGWIYFSSNPLI